MMETMMGTAATVETATAMGMAMAMATARMPPLSPIAKMSMKMMALIQGRQLDDVN
jgi:hypothetical protein